MADDGTTELWRQHRIGQDKYTYFLLAAAASGIAFSVQKTEGLTLSWQLLPVGLAVLAWGGSFYCGCQSLIWVQTALYANFSLLQLSRGTHPQQPAHPDHVRAATEGVRMAVDSNVSKAQFNARWQFRLVIVGALLFIAWHIWRLYRNACAV